MAYGYTYGGYPTQNYYNPAPPMPDQLAQLRGAQYQPNIIQPAQPQQPSQGVATTPQPASNGILWVQGEEGAKAWMVAPGATVMLMDSDGSSFYLKSADASGMPQPLRIFDYTERTAVPKPAADVPTPDYVTREDFNALKERADELAKELEALKTKHAKAKKEDSE